MSNNVVVCGMGIVCIDQLQQLVHVLNTDLFYLVDVFKNTTSAEEMMATIVSNSESEEGLEEAKEIIDELFHWSFFTHLRKLKDSNIIDVGLTDCPWRVVVKLPKGK